MKTWIGIGASSNVYSTGKGTAHKIIRRERNEPIDEIVLKEITYLRRIKSPYVVPLLDVITKEKKVSLVLPLAKTSLDKIIYKDSYDPKRVMYQLLLAVRDIHTYNILHLDIKPENILIREEGDIWLADLGLSNEYNPEYPIHNTNLYTIYYRPPELFTEKSEKPISFQSEIWAIGVTFAHILLSRRFGTRTYLFSVGNISRDTKDPLASLQNRGFTQEETTLLTKILKVNPEERPTIEEILDDPYFQGNLLPPLIPELRSTKYPKNNWEIFKNRQILIEWLFEVREEYNLSYRCLSLCIYLMDSIVAKNMVLIKEIIQVHSLACLLIAASFYDEMFTPENAKYISNNSCQPDEVVAISRRILTKTNYDLDTLNCLDILGLDYVDIWKVVVLTEDYFQDQRELAENLMV